MANCLELFERGQRRAEKNLPKVVTLNEDEILFFLPLITLTLPTLFFVSMLLRKAASSQPWVLSVLWVVPGTSPG